MVLLYQLQGKIKASIAKVWHQKGRSVDWELLEKMELHQKAVEAAIAPQSARGGKALLLSPIESKLLEVVGVGVLRS